MVINISVFLTPAVIRKKAIHVPSLRNRDHVGIKPADKGCAVVIMDKTYYIAEVDL